MRYFVAEGDESDGTIALFQPEHTVVLNIEEEHLDHYADLAAIEKVFRKLLDQTHGKIFYCIDDPNTTRLCEVRAIASPSDRAAAPTIGTKRRNPTSSSRVSRFINAGSGLAKLPSTFLDATT